VNWILGLSAALMAVLALGWGGLQVAAPPFPSVADAAGPTARVSVPAGLPAPVKRFYHVLYGSSLPVAESAVLTGRATLRIAGIDLPARWRFTHVVGEGYRHEIVACWFGLPILRVDERYVDGDAVLDLPFGREEGPAVDQGANLAMWTEAVWFPAALATHPAVQWTPIDDTTALLRVPFGVRTETVVARFDPTDDRLMLFEAMRYKGADAKTKTLWLNLAEAWGEVDGQPTATIARVQWLGDLRPWADFRIESLALNVPDARARLTAP
jgi:hypothetical protein